MSHYIWDDFRRTLIFLISLLMNLIFYLILFYVFVVSVFQCVVFFIRRNYILYHDVSMHLHFGACAKISRVSFDNF
jgi:hypothetical protein